MVGNYNEILASNERLGRGQFDAVGVGDFHQATTGLVELQSVGGSSLGVMALGHNTQPRS